FRHLKCFQIKILSNTVIHEKMRMRSFWRQTEIKSIKPRSSRLGWSVSWMIVVLSPYKIELCCQQSTTRTCFDGQKYVNDGDQFG
ncbi:Restriction of telomere capping protein, partial [Trichinella spiralis]